MLPGTPPPKKKPTFALSAKLWSLFVKKRVLLHVWKCVWPHAFTIPILGRIINYFNITFEFGMHLIKWVGSCSNNKQYLMKFTKMLFQYKSVWIIKPFPWAVQCCMAIKTRITVGPVSLVADRMKPE